MLVFWIWVFHSFSTETPIYLSLHNSLFSSIVEIFKPYFVFLFTILDFVIGSLILSLRTFTVIFVTLVDDKCLKIDSASGILLLFRIIETYLNIKILLPNKYYTSFGPFVMDSIQSVSHHMPGRVKTNNRSSVSLKRIYENLVCQKHRISISV